MDTGDHNEQRNLSGKKLKRDKKRKAQFSESEVDQAAEVTKSTKAASVNSNTEEHSAKNNESNLQNSVESGGRPEGSQKKARQDLKMTNQGPAKAAQPGSKPASLWNFTVDYNDHFETPPIAYKDIAPVLEALSNVLSKSPQELTIYDPYWCEGSMVAHLSNLGYDNVINRNRDFYMDIKKKNIPDYDILVTNPPYSGEHKVNLLKFLATHTAKTSCTASSTAKTSSTAITATATGSASASASSTTLPFALLLPVYTATKSYWKDFAQAQALVGKSAFYILPPDYYEYSHPEGTGKDIPPFYSAWFLGGFSAEQKNRILQSLRTRPRPAAPSTVKYAVPLKRLSFSVLTVAESVEALVSRGVVTDAKRPNPKQRQKMKQKK